MWPLGEYHRFVHEIKRRENKEIPVTCGLLIADYRQQMSREYILNYINRFDYKSDKYINFYLPGYFEDSIYKSKNVIKIKDQNYYFNEEKYMEFLMKLEEDFEIDFAYNPRLVLMEYDRGHFNKSKRIIIELDSEGADIKRTGELFESIFDIAKKHVHLDDISKALRNQELQDGLFDRVLRVMDNKLIIEIADSCNKIRRYKTNRKVQ
jgi:hypothetical protein